MRDEIRLLLPQNVEGEESLDLTRAGPLYSEEEAAVEHAVERRRSEFRAGRDCARRALRHLGCENRALPARSDRTVMWPEGVVGSITHTDDYAAAVVARVRHWPGLGIDAESRYRAGRELWPLIASEDEIEWFGAAGDTRLAIDRATLLFSAKESFYKAQYCITAKWVDFDEVRFRATLRGFEIELLTDLAGVGHRGRRFAGVFHEDAMRVVTLVALRASELE